MKLYLEDENGNRTRVEKLSGIGFSQFKTDFEDVPINIIHNNLDSIEKIKADIHMIKEKELLPLTGYVHGGCSPIGMKKQFHTVLDESALGYSSILFSAGKRGHSVELTPQALESVIPLKIEGANTRITTLLNSIGLENRICRTISELDKIYKTPIDYNKVNTKVNSLRENGIITAKRLLSTI